MRLFSLLLCTSVALTAYAWTKEDHEIFDLVSALEASEGKKTTFYSHLNIDSSATTSEITKAYRKKSMELHPDKNPGVKNIQDRFARLGVIAQILRSPEKRERYNFFYKNGVPIWRGTGYYYSRFRPTLLHVVAFLVGLTSLLHYLVMQLNYNKDIKRVEYFENTAKVSAGSKKDGVTRRRKVRVPMIEGSEGSGMLELIVEDDQVYLPHEDGSLTPLSDLATRPSYNRTWPVLLFKSLLAKTVSALPPSVQSSLPGFLVQASALAEAESVEAEQVSVPLPTKSRTSSLKQRSRTSTPKDSPSTTEVESDAEDGEVVDAADGSGVEKKKKKNGLGKAAGARRRKMGKK
ncbi:hypothetical protein P7C73_g4869, partial [Tremellales sp. Uapishka_1]